MKDKIMYLILGILIGAVITAGCFLVLQKKSTPQIPEDFKNGREFRGERLDDGEFQNRIKNGDFQNRVNDGEMLEKHGRGYTNNDDKSTEDSTGKNTEDANV